MSESKTSEDIKHIIAATTLLVSNKGKSKLIKAWYEANDLWCCIAVAKMTGYVTDITPEGEEEIRKAFDSLAKELDVTSSRLIDIVYEDNDIDQ